MWRHAATGGGTVYFLPKIHLTERHHWNTFSVFFLRPCVVFILSPRFPTQLLYISIPSVRPDSLCWRDVNHVVTDCETR